MSGITILSKSPGPSFYLDGMQLGQGIDAITGEISQSAIDPSFTVQDISSTHSGETLLFRSMDDVTELERSQAAGITGSLTFPADGVMVGAKSALDFTNSSQSSTSILLIVLDWERHGQSKQLSGAKLSSGALSSLTEDKGSFRDKYGDYFIYQISYMTKFTAVWKCTAETSTDIKEFKHEISGSISASEVKASGSFTTKLNEAAKNHRVVVEVQYEVVGSVKSANYDMGDIIKTFNSFRDAASPVPYEVLLHHYSIADHKVPVQISMEPDVFQRICNVFTLARFVLFLIGVVPSTRSVRLARRNKLNELFREIHAKRIIFQDNPEALKNAIRELEKMREMLWVRFERQDLVTEMRSITYEDMKRKFAVEHENVRGAWVEDSENTRKYVLGRTGFGKEEQIKYAVSHVSVAEVNVSYETLGQRVGALEFPGTSGINGYVVGLEVVSRRADGTNGWWCIGRQLKLGMKQAKVEVKTRGSRGMHWELVAHYIPSSEYDE